tara:strand:+ start:2505 stop:2984 length:480 start_codon:yes stop_codon:yes gene_type:complete
MADYYGVNFTKFDQNTPKEMAAVAEHGGRMRVQYDSYEASAIAAAKTIAVARMPKGSRVWQVILVADASGSTTSTLAVGDSGSAARFVSALKMNAANKVSAMYPKVSDTHGAVTLDGGMSGAGIDSFGHEYTSATDIIVTVGTAAYSGTIKVAVFYTVD